MARKKKEFLGSDVEYEQENGHVLTRGKLILIILILVLVVFLIIFIISKVNKAKENKKEKYLESDFIRLEERMTEESPIYLSQKNIEVEDEYKIDLKDLFLENGGSIDSNKTKASKVCKGYVLVKNSEGLISYKPYISCEKYYQTKGYVSDVTTTKKTTVKDLEKPVITLKGDKDITINVNEKYDEPGFIATDNIDGDITSDVKISGDVNTSVPATYIVTYTVQDKAGNKVVETRKVNVINVVTTTTRTNNVTTKKITTSKTTQRITTPPKIILTQASISIVQGTSYNIYSGYSAHDAKGVDITSKVKISGSVNTSVPGTYYVTYSVTDSYGNKASTVKTIVVTSRTTSYIKLKSISLSNDSITIKSGATQKIYVVSFYPTNTTNKNVTWKSGNSSVVSIVSTNGLEVTIKGNKPGREYITVYGADGITKNCLVIVQ